ncbi:ankyrin repeat domain-containing protein 16 [Anabrus simplex]|uniref:ankyrin repeat domain-containing protein 16 n=1 Tax=Anabrus simplex TaxID=316456 RepID=UPI0035A3433A
MDLLDEDPYEKLCGIPEKDIFVAILNNNPLLLNDVLRCLKEEGRYWMNCIQKKSGRTPLHACARAGHFEIMRLLCEEWNTPKFSLEVSDIHGRTCLHEAAQACFPTMVEYLIRQGAKIDSLKKGDWTPLMLACTKIGKPAVNTIKVLLKSGANIKLSNKDGWTPLHIAVREGDTEVISLLISKEADVSAVTKNGRTLLHIAALNSQVKAVELLVNNYHISVNDKDMCGITPLLDAAIGGCEQIARLLINKGACVNQVDAMGLSCLHLAAESGHDSMVKFLIQECGMNVNLQAEGTAVTPLHCASRANQKATAKILLDLGADVNLLARGRTVAGASYGVEEEELRYVFEEVMNIFT